MIRFVIGLFILLGAVAEKTFILSVCRLPTVWTMLLTSVLV